MKYSQIGIATRREAPARARTQGEAFLVRAGYLSLNHELTPLAQLSISRLESASSSLPDTISKLGLPSIQLENNKIALPMASGALEVLQCPVCGYADEAELARARKVPLPPESPLPLRRTATPDCNTIDALAELLGIEKARTAKAMMYTRLSDEKLVLVVVRGDMQVSERKVAEQVGAIRPANSHEMAQAGAMAGYASPIGVHDALVVADDLIPQSANLAVGANEYGFHLLNANFGRDFGANVVEDVTRARAGDPCRECGTSLASLNATLVVDASGSRPASLLLALAEVFHDERGLRWPQQVAPFDVYMVLLSSKQMDLQAPAEALCRALEAAGIRVLFDDRDERAGVKFKDADLIGCPVRLTIGERNLQSGMIELKRREEDQIQTVKLTEARDNTLALLRDPNA